VTADRLAYILSGGTVCGTPIMSECDYSATLDAGAERDHFLATFLALNSLIRCNWAM